MAARKDYTSRKENKSHGGIGESRIFGGNYTRGDGEELPDGLKWESLTVGGRAITDLFPEGVHCTLTFQQTDQGMTWWEKNRHRLENHDDPNSSPETRGMRLPTGDDATDPFEKEIIAFRDNSLKKGLNRAKDPFAGPMRDHIPAGFKGLWMSRLKINQEGLTRGLLDYQVVRDKDGNEVTRGNMVLGMVPEELAAEAQSEYEQHAKDQMVSAVETMREQSEQIISKAKLDRVAKKHGMSDAVSGITHEDGDGVNGQVMGEFGREFA